VTYFRKPSSFNKETGIPRHPFRTVPTESGDGYRCRRSPFGGYGDLSTSCIQDAGKSKAFWVARALPFMYVPVFSTVQHQLDTVNGDQPETPA
jgi:hypothetical protein